MLPTVYNIANGEMVTPNCDATSSDAELSPDAELGRDVELGRDAEFPDAALGGAALNGDAELLTPR